MKSFRLSIRSLSLTVLAVALVALGIGLLLIQKSLLQSLRTEQLWNLSSSLKASTGPQIDELIPGLVVKERVAGNALILLSIKRSENLADVKVVESLPKITGVCRDLQCIDMASATSYVAVPIKYMDKTLGYLTKQSNPLPLTGANLLSRPLAAVFILYGLFLFGVLSALLYILETSVRRPLKKLREALERDETIELGQLQGHIEDFNALTENVFKMKTQAELGRLASQVAHDIRSPLAALDAVSETVKSFPEDQRQMVRSAISRIRDIANSLLDNYKPHTSLGIPRSDICLVSSLLDRLVTEQRLQYRARLNMDIEYSASGDAYGLFATIDPVQFARIVSNLVNNSVEAISGPGRIDIRLESDANLVQVEIRDNGKGIPADLLSTLGHRQRTYGKEFGSGLGLYHARSTIEAWGGSLQIESTEKLGTNVLISLPKAPCPLWFQKRISVHAGENVVILDDDISIHHVWQSRFDALDDGDGVKLWHLSTPEEFRTWVKNNSACLYLVDYELIGSANTGLELIEELQLASRAILVTSRFENRGVLEKCVKLGVKLVPKGLAGFVPIDVEVSKPHLVLIDDDDLVHFSWKMAAERRGKKLLSCKNADVFLKFADRIPFDTPIYVDCQLADDVSGEAVTYDLACRGFKNLYLATGLASHQVKIPDWVKGKIGKSPPWGKFEETILASSPS